MPTGELNVVDPWPQSTPAERELVQKVSANVQSWKGTYGQDFKERCDHFYRLYRGYSRYRHAWAKASPNDKDDVLSEMQSEWGANLHIPYVFSTIEVQVPRAVAQRPRMLFLPRHPRWEDNVESVRLLIDSQQENIDIDLAYQDVLRYGFTYGLGWGKSYWRREFAPEQRVKRRIWSRVTGQDEFMVGKARMRKVFDDPMFEALDPYDVFWDPLGWDMRTCRWIVHRQWMTLEDVLEMIELGAWSTEAAQKLTEDDIRRMGGGQEYDTVWNERMEASGFGQGRRSQQHGEQVHEVWEWHDGYRVLTVLDGQVLVQNAPSPCMGHMPFCAYRPTPDGHQLPGISEIAPIEHLQREMDTLRSQRRDAATIALAAGYAYDSSAIDEENLVFGPAAAIRVDNARPGDALMPLPRQDVPYSSYREAEEIRNDILMVTGANENPSSVTTATEAQIVQATADHRVGMKSRRFEIEVVRASARAFLKLNQRMILNERAPMPHPDMDPYEAAQSGRYQWVQIGPGELMGEFEIIPDGGSMAAENKLQQLQEAQAYSQMFLNRPELDQRKVWLKILRLSGEKEPRSMLAPEKPMVPADVLDRLRRVLPAQLVDDAVSVVMAEVASLPPDQTQPQAQERAAVEEAFVGG